MKNKPEKPIYMGIDVSKDDLVTARFAPPRWERGKLPNTIEAIEAWLDGLELGSLHFVFEATGPYSERLAHCLHLRGAAFSMVNPSQSRAMSRVLSRRNKTDEQDAQTLGMLGEKIKLMPYHMPQALHKRRKEAFSALAALQKQRLMVQNQLHSLSHLVDPNPAVVAAFEQVLVTVEQSIVAVEKELKPEQGVEEASGTVRRLATIKGVGTATAQAFVALFGNFEQFGSAKAFANFIGIAPSEFSSGKSVRGRSPITKKDSSQLRSMLFNCARSAMQFNSECRALYLRLVEKGKNGKVALTAVMHKLARQIFGVARSGICFDPNFAAARQNVA